MRPRLEGLTRQVRARVAVIGVVQEFQRAFTGTTCLGSVTPRPIVASLPIILSGG
ncbi:MAG: hypothetical protein ACRDRE_25845 [Pseudonocardiaceae bacterium]